MSLDATIPTSATLGSDLPAMLREMRTAINTNTSAIAAVGSVIPSIESVNLAAGSTEFDAEGGLIHTISITADAAVSITDITGGRAGQILLLRAGDGDITLVHADAKIKLNGSIDANPSENDWIVLVNFGGDPDTGVNGVWVELFRTTWT